jgi:hypothetical protein
VLVVVIATRGDDKPAMVPSTPSAAPIERDDLPPVGQIEVRPPPNLGGKSGRDWEKVVDKVYNHEFERALEELDKWERKYGARDETQYLRAQLVRLAREDGEE